MTSAMILAAGRGERMRPLSDATPKPLLRAGGKPLIAWQIEALARGGFTDIVINVAQHAEILMSALRAAATPGVDLRFSREAEPLETAGGVAYALPLLEAGPALIVSGDIWTRFDYASLGPRITAMASDPAAPRAHLVMVPNPPYHPEGDFAFDGGRLSLADHRRLTYGNIGVYDTALFAGLVRGEKHRMLPLFNDWIARGIASGERYDGPWANVGTPEDLRALDLALANSPPPGSIRAPAP